MEGKMSLNFARGRRENELPPGLRLVSVCLSFSEPEKGTMVRRDQVRRLR